MYNKLYHCYSVTTTTDDICTIMIKLDLATLHTKVYPVYQVAKAAKSASVLRSPVVRSDTVTFVTPGSAGLDSRAANKSGGLAGFSIRRIYVQIETLLNGSRDSKVLPYLDIDYKFNFRWPRIIYILLYWADSIN